MVTLNQFIDFSCLERNVEYLDDTRPCRPKKDVWDSPLKNVNFLKY